MEILVALDGDRAALPSYAALVSRSFAAFRSACREHYGGERRWPDARYDMHAPPSQPYTAASAANARHRSAWSGLRFMIELLSM